MNSLDVTEPSKPKPVNASYCRPKVERPILFLTRRSLLFVSVLKTSRLLTRMYISFNVTHENFAEHQDNLCQLGRPGKKGVKIPFPILSLPKF